MKAMGEAALSVVAENQGATKRNVDTFAKLAEKYKIDLMENTDEYRVLHTWTPKKSVAGKDRKDCSWRVGASCRDL